MTKKREPTLRQQWLGQQLRELRHSAGLGLDGSAEFLQRTAGTISRFESAEYPIRRPDLMALLDLYGITAARQREPLLQLGDDAWQKGWWDGYADDAGGFVDYLWLESRAERISSYNAMFVPGLVQTRSYAAALIRNDDGTADEEQLERWIEMRMRRQQVLDEGKTELSVIVDESVLRRPIDGADVLRDQLTHLLEVSERPEIDIRVLPFDVGVHAGLDGTFLLFDMPAPYSQVAYVETAAGRVYVESPDAQRFARAYDRLHKQALEPKASEKLISVLIKELR